MFWIGLIIGFAVGVVSGVFALSLAQAGKERDYDEE